MFGEAAELSGDLHGQLTGRGKDDALHFCPRWVEQLNHGDAKRCSFARARLRAANNITALEHVWNRLLLDGCGGFVAHVVEGQPDWLRYCD